MHLFIVDWIPKLDFKLFQGHGLTSSELFFRNLDAQYHFALVVGYEPTGHLVEQVHPDQVRDRTPAPRDCHGLHPCI